MTVRKLADYEYCLSPQIIQRALVNKSTTLGGDERTICSNRAALIKLIFHKPAEKVLKKGATRKKEFDLPRGFSIFQSNFPRNLCSICYFGEYEGIINESFMKMGSFISKCSPPLPLFFLFFFHSSKTRRESLCPAKLTRR